MAKRRESVGMASSSNGSRNTKKQFRCSMSGVVNIFKKYKNKLKDLHLEAMKKTPFFSIFNCLKLGAIKSSDCRRVDSVSEEIMKRFNPKTKKFEVGGLEGEITKQDVKLIFGIVDGEMPLGTLKLGKKEEWSFCNRMFGGHAMLNQKLIKEKIGVVLALKSKKAEDVDDVVRLICLLAFASVFFSRNGVTMPWGWVEYVEDLDNMRSYDWSGGVLSMLVESLVEYNKSPYQVKGCTILPLYWLCEHTEIISQRENMRDVPTSIPRLVKWHLPKMKDKLVKDITGDMVNVNELRMRKRERKWYDKMANWDGKLETDFEGDDTGVVGEKEKSILEDVEANVEEELTVNLSDLDYFVTESGTQQLERKVREMKKMYADLLQKHDDLEQRFGEKEEENSDLREKLSSTHGVPLACKLPVLDGKNVSYEELARMWMAGNDEMKKKEDEIWKLNEKISLMSAELSELRSEMQVKVRENEESRSTFADLVEKLANKNNIRRVDLDEERWHNEFVEEHVHMVTQEFSPKPNAVVVDEMKGPNSRIDRIRKRVRKANNLGDDFVVERVNSKPKKEHIVNSRSKDKGLDMRGFLALLDLKYKGHCARLINPKYLSDFLVKYNSEEDETVYYSRKPLVVLPVSHIMHILKGFYISNSVVDAYGARLLKGYRGERFVTIITADCWSRVMENQDERLFERINVAVSKENSIVLFPILSTGKTGTGAEHWTLLVYYVCDHLWLFFNSKRPRTSGTRDKYFVEAAKVKVILEKRWSESEKPKFELLSQTQIPLIPVTRVPSQGATNDCAIFTCYFMKCVVMGTDPDPNLSPADVQKFKAELIETIIAKP